jgi:hypothetical protein
VLINSAKSPYIDSPKLGKPELQKDKGTYRKSKSKLGGQSIYHRLLSFKMDLEKYPNIQVATAFDEKEPSRTVKILQPNIVLFTIVILTTCSIIGIAIAVSAFTSSTEHSMTVVASLAGVITSVNLLAPHI